MATSNSNLHVTSNNLPEVSSSRPASTLENASVATALLETKKVANPYIRIGKAIANPYAKKSAPPQASSIVPPSRAAIVETSLSCSTVSHRQVDHGPYASFSQAFSSLQDTEQFMIESENLRKKGPLGAASAVVEEDRKKQREVDATTGESSSVVSAIGQLAGVMIQPRDLHAHLQPHVLHVSTKQQGNPILKHVRNVPFSFSNIVPDYIMGQNRCALFLSLRYHSLHPEYIHRRISELKSDFMLRVLLVLVDVEDNSVALLALNKLTVLQNMSLLLTWTDEEAGRYLETFKAFESKDASLIQKKEKDTFADQVSDVICTIRSVNKTDVSHLMSQFGSFRALAMADMDQLSLVPGIGSKKVRRLHEAFHKPFSAFMARKRKSEGEEEKKTKGDENN